jgi:GT2 family glycosyltransferase
MFPIAVISFNRPDYLEQVLDSLAKQEPPIDSPIALFQDGVVNPISGNRYGDDSLPERNVTMFMERFPRGRVFRSPCNLGVALNYDRAERWLFEEQEAEAGMIFEDDMILSPHYVRTLEAMLQMALKDGQVSYVACYGDEHKPSAEQNPTGYSPLRFNWAFGLTRQHWLANKPRVDAYLEIARTFDYRIRDIKALKKLYQSWGIEMRFTTQDVVKTAVCCLNGSVKLNTRARFGAYIGSQGLHGVSSRNKDDRPKIEMYPKSILDFEPPDQETFERCFKEQDRWTGRTLGDRK